MKHLRFSAKTFLIIGIIWMSCNEKSGPVKETNQVATDSIVKDDHEHDRGHNAGVTLNNGQKWSANQETTAGINTMKDLISFRGTELKTVDCINLKSRLETEYGNILSKCTMKGEAHEQLHNFLIPLQGMIQGLGTDSLDSCKEKINHLNSYLDEFGNYFQ